MADRAPGYRDVQPVQDLVTDEECYEAMQFLDKICDYYAEAQADADYIEYNVGVTEAVGAMLSDERSVDKRKWDARTSPSYAQQLKALRTARMRFLKIKAQREAAQLKIEVWRTIHADKRLRDIAEPGRRQ